MSVRRRTGRRTVLLPLLVALVLAGCSADSESLTTEATALELPGLEGLPLPDSAAMVTPSATVDGITTQAFEVTGDTPAGVMAFYEEVFSAWTPVVAPAVVGLGGEVQAGGEAAIYRGGWSDGERDVLVTTGPADGRIQVVTLNVQVGPEGSGVFDFEDSTEAGS